LGSADLQAQNPRVMKRLGQTVADFEGAVSPTGRGHPYRHTYRE
jgi:hypothetical protein